MKTDRLLGAGLIALAIAGIFMTMQISVRTFNDDLGPKLFPMLGFGILLLCGLGMLLTATRRAGAPSDGQGSDDAGGGSDTGRGAVMFGLLVVYSIALWLLGYYVATPLLVYVFYHTIAGPERRVWWRGALYALAVTGAVHLMFSVLLNTLLPTGILF